MKYPITREGYDRLKKDLEYMLNTKRPKILMTIEEARAAWRYIRERGV